MQSTPKHTYEGLPSWKERKVKFPERSKRDTKDFIKLEDGDSVTGVCAGDIYTFRQHWNGKVSTPCPENNTCTSCDQGIKTQFKFRVNFITKDDTGNYTAKILEQGAKLLDGLEEINKEYELEKHAIKISRKGKGVNDTKYTVMPVKNGALTEEKLELFSKIDLHDLKETGEQKNSVSEEKTTEPKFDNEEELPF